MRIKCTEKELNDLITEMVREIREGVDIDYETRTVTYNPSHQDNVDTSFTHNPTVDDGIMGGIKVWSIFKRKQGVRGDGNPLIYALKCENDWKFRSQRDREQVEAQFEAIASKFARMYQVGVTIILPSGNSLNRYIASVISKKSKNAKILEGVICKLTTEEVDDIVMKEGSAFRNAYGPNFNVAYRQLGEFLDDMDRQRNGYFTRHMVKDQKMRDVLDFTFKVSPDRYAEFARDINGRDILLIDDTISRGQTIKDAIKTIRDAYAPKSITVLTLLSRLH